MGSVLGAASLDLHEPETVLLDEATRELTEAVNRHVNRTITQTADLEHWGKVGQ
jgi:predicted transglutaminase-like cysteine proteinase